MYKFYDCDTNNQIMDMSSAQFINKLKLKWDDIHEDCGVFRYQIDNLFQKNEGKYIMLLNPKRSKYRRAPETIDNIRQPFDIDKFNFTKVRSKEILFTLVRNNDENDKHRILVNVSPINRYHSLICPSVLKCLPQIVTVDSLTVVLEIMHYAQDRDLRIGYNSLCALASLNHLHYHMFLESRTLPVENEKCKKIKGPLYYLKDYIVQAFCLEVTSDLNQFIVEAFKLLSFLLDKSIAHNIFITRGKGLDYDGEITRMIIFPRKSCAGAKQLNAFNVAVCELAGWMPIYKSDYYEEAKCEDLENELKSWMYEDFENLCNEVQSLY